MKTGNTAPASVRIEATGIASMEPGHEDREYWSKVILRGPGNAPQWSPVMKTGNTSRRWMIMSLELKASMEPGHEDREYTRSALM